MKQLLALPFILLLVQPLHGQSQGDESFNQEFLRIYMEIASKDVGEALMAADSLYRHAQGDLQEIRSLMLISDMHHRMANRDSAIHYAVRAERIAQASNNHIWHARICGVLSTQHREMGLLNEGKRYLKKGLEVVRKVEESNFVQQFKGQSYQEWGYYEIAEEKYSEAVTQFKRAEPFFLSMADTLTRDFALAQNNERLGNCYISLGKLDSAKYFYIRASKNDRQASAVATPIRGFIEDGLGYIALEEKKYGEADSLLHSALAISEACAVPNLKMSVYKHLADYYRNIGDLGAYGEYNEKYLREVERNTDKHRRYADDTVVRAQQRLQEIVQSNRTLRQMVIGLVLAVGVGTLIVLGTQRKKRRRYRAVISKLREERIRLMVDQSSDSEELAETERELMPERTKQELLRKLEQFESTRQFTERNISIAVLAAKMRTNTKYLSHLINTYRKKDFNGYINELRIKYIVEKMETDHRYHQYKISYLAEECGFATHSQFTTVFRNVTGLSPSTFMTYLRKDDQLKDTTVLN